MDEKQLQALANELAKNLKTPEDLSQFDRLLKKLSVEAALNAEMTHHLGYEKNQSRPGANSRNGYSTKTVITGDGPLELRTPRDRDGTFEPQLVKKNQTRITGMDNQLLSLYAKGMTTREIAAAFKERKRLARTVLIFTESSDQGVPAGNLDFSATSNGVGCILAGSSQYTLVSGPHGPLTRRYAPTSGKPSSGPLRPRTETGMRTISWTALSFQSALLAVRFGTDGTQR
ncbi:hypothetical protein OkiPb00232_48090 [Escherichia coli]|nr:transposase [Escherichia coli]EGB59832.1 hypothetical protein ERJG_04296 [Escherichia coli M863]BDI39358.1 hypothetical protein EsCdI10290_05585 [Escherichia sp. 10290]BDI49182.1 hypothetical protein EsCd1HHP049_05436 [Escherichia sp. HH154_1D]BDI54004.1 transposase [Escherichia sp. KS167_9B]